jgi:hypothetical protein
MPRAIASGTCDYRESGHDALGGVCRQFANNFVVCSGRRTGKPADLEFSAIGLHHIEAIAVDIEDGKAGRQRLGESFAGCGPHRIVKLRATEIIDDRHT